jgi:hypothetical protein
MSIEGGRPGGYTGTAMYVFAQVKTTTVNDDVRIHIRDEVTMGLTSYDIL